MNTSGETDEETADRVSRRLHTMARRATHDHAHGMGTAYRVAANEVRRAWGLPELDYDGNVETTEAT